MSNDKLYSLVDIEKMKLLPNPPFPKDRTNLRLWIIKGRLKITSPSVIFGKKTGKRYYIAQSTLNQWRQQYNQSPIK